MSFEVPADAYGRFMGRYSTPLAHELLGLVAPQSGQRALDVGCGPGVLARQLVDVLGAEAVAAVDPSAAFVAAARELLPGVDVRQASAEALPFPDDAFDIALAALVVHFMSDPVAGIAEMARVTRPGGFVAASVWDYENERSPVSAFWRAAGDLDPEAPGELQLPGVREGQLLDYFERAGLRDVRPTTLAVHVEVAGFDDWWEPYTLGTGPAGAYVAGLDAQRRAALRAHCAELLPDGPFTVDASAWAATGRVRST